MAAGLSARLCRMVAALRYEDLSAAAVGAATDVLVDATGTMLAAAAISEEVRPFVDLARASGTGPCTILGTKETASAAMAALANGALSHALDFEDTHDATAGHPNASLVPALIALAQSEGDIDGKALVTALVAGCEVSCRMALALRQPLEEGGWYPPPILAGIGATVGAAKLLDLGEGAMLDALSLALCQLTMPGQIKHEPRSTIRSVREAFPAQAAVQSALLARGGVQGFARPLEGEGGFFALFAGGLFESTELVRPFTEPLAVEELTFKPWPSCRGTHGAIELALEYRTANPGPLPDITRIVVEHDGIQSMLVHPLDAKRAPEAVIGAKFSIPFCTALALYRGQIDLDGFGAGLSNPQVLTLAARVEGREIVDARRGRGVGAALELWSSDTLLHRAEIAEPKGSPSRRLTKGEIDEKFLECTRLRDAILALEAERLLLSIRNSSDHAAIGEIFASHT